MDSRNLGRLKYPEYCPIAIGRCWAKQKSKKRTSCPCPSTNEMHINSHPASRSFHLLARYSGVLEEDTTCMLSMRYVLLVAGTSFESRPNRGSSTLYFVVQFYLILNMVR